ncbi:RbsD / FucU transport protein family [Vibrio sp. B1REV9]|uniref:L-fucose mutarotase n=1 Tax=Vibrio sp. B1REV9 TaxID=2751179 RepID=UPI001AFA5871|nr:L-fucose mutarotase [Vibrio sp. B1REV9]CAE6938298.1 RbsD / FucU transport protein family [Vibrio sp. B1REV9]
MLKGIHPAISPKLLATLSEMGHGDEILFADAHFPAHTFGQHVIRCDGVGVDTLLTGVVALFELDQYVDQPVVMMQAVPGDELDPNVEKKYLEAMTVADVKQEQIERVERFAFYERVKQCYAVVLTGETAKYGNIILKKGVTTF